MSDAESIDVEEEEGSEVEEGKWMSARPSRSSSFTSSSPDPAEDIAEVITAGSPLHRWVDAELLSFLHSAIMAPESVPGDNENSDDEESGRSQTMRTAESVVNKISLPREESRGRKEGALQTYDLSTENLSYKITIRRRGKLVQEKVLLNNITAEARHGEVMAIMGPSGASKSTYLDALAGRISRKSMSGSVLVNGVPMTEQFKHISGYVMQDDVHFPYLTARETLMYSARLRLPSNIPMKEKRGRVEAILELLGLKACADTKIGNEEIGGVSGGERRRISIALDLIHDPMVLFLDEPTSGLDSTSALQVMQCLQKLAKERSRTVILSLHQPSYRMLDTIDNTLVLAKGNVIYKGHHTDMIKFFSSLGWEKPEHVTVVEYLIDKIEESKGDLEQLKPKQSARSAQMKKLRHRTLSSYEYKVHAADETPATEPELQIMSEDQPRDPGPGQCPVKFANSLLSEAWVLSCRNFHNMIRENRLFISRIAITLATSLIMATLFHDAGRNEKGLRERQVFFVFAVAMLVLTSMDAMPVFLMERRIFVRETSRGAYRASSYVLSYSIVVLPFMLVLALLFTASSYFAVGLVVKANAILYFVLVIFLVLSIANAFVAALSGWVPNFITGLMIFGAASAYQFLFCGFFVPRHHIPKYWLWVHYGSFFTYCYEALLVNELRNIQGHTWVQGRTSETILHDLDMKRDIRSQAFNIVYLVCFFLGFRFFLYFSLRFQTNNIRK